MSGDIWRWADPAGEQWRVHLDELRAALRSGAVPPNAPVWRVGWSDWRLAWDVPELAPGPKDASTTLMGVPPPPLAMLAIQAVYEGEEGAPREEDPPPPPRYAPAPEGAGHGSEKLPPVEQNGVARSGSKLKTVLMFGGQGNAPSPAAPARAKAATAPTLRPPSDAVIPAAAMRSSPPPTVEPTPTQTRSSRPPPPRPERASPSRPPPRVDLAASSLPRAPPRPASSRPPPPVRPSTPPPLPVKAESRPPPPLLPSRPPPVAVPRPTPPPSPVRRREISDASILASTAATASSFRPEELSDSALIDVPSALDSAPLPVDSSQFIHSPVPAPVAASPTAMTVGAPNTSPAPANVTQRLPSQSAIRAQSPSYLPPTDPVYRPDPGDDAEASMPARRGIVSLAGDISAVQPKNRFVLPVVATLGGVLGLLLLAGFVTLARSWSSATSSQAPPDKGATTIAVSTASASAAPSEATRGASAASTIVVPTAAGGKPRALGACKIQGSPHVLAPKALVPVGVELGMSGDDALVGFAAAPKEAVTMTLNKVSLWATATERLAVWEPITRVSPLVQGGKLLPVVDLDRGTDTIQGRHASGNLAIDVGAAEGHLVWAPRGSSSHARLWPLPDDRAKIEALRAIPFHSAGAKGYVVVFRAGARIAYGVVVGEGQLVPQGELTYIAGLGPAVGSPAVATSGERVAVAFADRASKDDAWLIRGFAVKIGDAAPAPKVFPVPPGGPGVKVMSPALLGLGEERFLLSWTEGPPKKNEIRLAEIDAGFAVVGDPQRVSPADVNAGQSQLGVDDGGQGLAAYLAERGGRFEVTAMPLVCERR